MKLMVGAAAAAVLGSAVVLAGPAMAMGTGNPYEDMQVGVTYTVYQPSYTAGLKTPKTGGDAAQCPTGTEENLLVNYKNSAGMQFAVYEGQPMCSDIGEGTTVAQPTVKGVRATVVAYCEPDDPCTRADVKKLGGHLSVVLPAAPGLRKTTVWIETSGRKNVTAAQLIRIARSLAPVG